MTIIHQKQTGVSKISSSEYDNEDELQKIIADNPELILAETEPSIELVQREVSLPDKAGRVDIVFIDSEGLPILVEVKLERNRESRREVIAQIFDYVSAFTQFTIYEFDDAVGGSLMIAINKLVDDQSNINIGEAIKKKCSSNLSAGRAKLVLAVDKARDDLTRIVEYVNDHSDLDVRLVEIKKYPNKNKENIFIPNIIVNRGKHIVAPVRATPEETSTRRLIKQILLQLVPIFNAQYGGWLKKLESTISEDILKHFGVGYLNTFRTYQGRNIDWASLYINILYNDNKTLVVSFAIATDMVDGQEGFAISLSSRHKTSTFIDDVKASKEISDFFKRNNFQFELNENGWWKYIPNKITYENAEEIATQEIEAIKPIVEKLLA